MLSAVVAIALAAGGGCRGGGRGGGEGALPPAPRTMRLESAAFADGALIPVRFTCDGEDLSPPLSWRGAPTGSVEAALVVDDPDAPGGTFVHWVAWALPPGPVDVPAGRLPAGARQGTNGFGHPGWGGPCPPKGDRPHRYIFTVLALQRAVSLAPGASRGELVKAVSGHVSAEGVLVGRYGRS